MGPGRSSGSASDSTETAGLRFAEAAGGRGAALARTRGMEGNSTESGSASSLFADMVDGGFESGGWVGLSGIAASGLVLVQTVVGKGLCWLIG